MTNAYYNRSINQLPAQRVGSSDLKNEFQSIAGGFDGVAADVARAVKLPEGTADQTISLSAGARANLVLAFDSAGNIAAISYGRWRGDWATATAYVVGDYFRDPVTKNIYSSVIGHTSSVLATDISSGKVQLAINVADVEAAKTAAEAAAQLATTQADAASASASASANASASSSAAANYKGPWASLSGALAIPASVSHGGDNDVYMLLESVANVTAHVPGVSTKWKKLVDAVPAGDVITTARTLAAPKWLKCDGASYLRSSYPAVEALLPSPPPDGVTWTQRTLPTSTDWQSVTYGNGVFVAVATGGTIAATSPNGVTWTQRTLPTSTNWHSVTYGNGVFVTVAYGTTIAATSPNGVTWTQRTLPTSTNWISVTYGNGVFVAVAYGGTTIAATSPDGVTWTQRTLPTSTNWRSVTYGNGLFVAVATGGTIAATSPDGVTWTQRTLPTSTNWISVTYGNGLFVAVAPGGTIAATSPDGVTWTQRTLPTSAIWISVTYGNGLFVAMGQGGTIAATSPDGVTWTQRTLPTSTNWISVTYGNGVFVAVATITTIAATSSGDPTKFIVPQIADPALCRTYIKATT